MRGNLGFAGGPSQGRERPNDPPHYHYYYHYYYCYHYYYYRPAASGQVPASKGLL